MRLTSVPYRHGVEGILGFCEKLPRLLANPLRQDAGDLGGTPERPCGVSGEWVQSPGPCRRGAMGPQGAMNLRSCWEKCTAWHTCWPSWRRGDRDPPQVV